MKRGLIVRIFSPPLVWTCQKKKKDERILSSQSFETNIHHGKQLLISLPNLLKKYISFKIHF
jgi:hypothetical protein